MLVLAMLLAGVQSICWPASARPAPPQAASEAARTPDDGAVGAEIAKSIVDRHVLLP